MPPELKNSPPNPSVVAAEAAAKAVTDAQTPPTTLPSSPAASTPPTPTAPAAASAPDGKATPPAWWAELEKADEKELRRHPKLSGLIGTSLEREREKLVRQERERWESERRQQEAEQRARAEEAERERLRVADPYRFAQAEGERKAAENRTAEERKRIIDGEVAWLESQDLPEAEVAELRNKRYTGTFEEGLRAFRDDVSDRKARVRAESEAEKRVAAREKEIRASERALVLAELNGGEPAPDVNGGHGGPGRHYTPQQIAKMSAAEYAKLGKTPKERWEAVGLR